MSSIDMFMIPQLQLLLLGRVAEILGVKPHQIVYAITSRAVQDVGLRLGNRRIFRASDVERLAAHFGIEPPAKENNG